MDVKTKTATATMRLSDEGKRLLVALAQRKGVSQTAVVEMLVREEARRERLRDAPRPFSEGDATAPPPVEASRFGSDSDPYPLLTPEEEAEEERLRRFLGGASARAAQHAEDVWW